MYVEKVKQKKDMFDVYLFANVLRLLSFFECKSV